jgi:oxygen-dependent protoporphyrinogen oxidase
MGSQLSQQGNEETVAQFFSRHLGAEAAEPFVAPFVSGVYAGDVHQLSAKAAFGQVTELADAGGGLLAGAILSHRQRNKPMTPTDSSIPKTKPEVSE